MRTLIIPTLIIYFLLFLTPVTADADTLNIGYLNSIDAYLEDHMQRSSIPGLSYAIIHNGKIVHMNALGIANNAGRPMTPQTPLYIGSVGKTFTALAIRQLVNAGKIDLNTPVVFYLTDFTLADRDASRQITIQHLLTHTSGLGNQDGNDPILYQPNLSNKDLVDLLEDFRPNRPVGTSYEYSNINYIILGRVIEVVSGSSYGEYIQQNIFKPLEMNHSFADEEIAKLNGLSSGYQYYFGWAVPLDLDEPEGAAAAGFLMASAEDMAHYLIAFTEHGRYKGSSIVNPDGQPHPEDLRLTYDIHWLTEAEAPRAFNTETHSGGWLNYSAGIAFMPAEKIGVVVLANSNPAQWLPAKDAFDLTYDVLRLYTGNPPNPPEPLLSQQYLLVDSVLLAILGFIVYRFATVRRWASSLNSREGNFPNRQPVIFFDLFLPLMCLLVLPVLILSSSGHLNPIWCWKRLVYQIPDVACAILALSSWLLLIGLTKIGLWVRFRTSKPN